MKNWKTTSGAALLTALVLFFASCEGGKEQSATGEKETAGEVQITEAWARAVPESMNMSAAYMKINNGTRAADAIVSASSNVSEVTELHEMAMVNETMKMRQVEKIELPAGETVELKPGGLHVMLIKLKQPLKEGDTVNLTLQLKNAGEMKVEAPVKKSDMKMKGHGAQEH